MFPLLYLFSVIQGEEKNRIIKWISLLSKIALEVGRVITSDKRDYTLHLVFQNQCYDRLGDCTRIGSLESLVQHHQKVEYPKQVAL